MIRLYATLIIAKRRTIERVPEKFREAVIEELRNESYDEKGDPIEG